MDHAAPTDPRVWVAPSRGQLFWLRHAPALFGCPPARVGHAMCMPVIVAALLAALCPLGGRPFVNASLFGALGLAAWWLAWAGIESDPVWGGCGVLVIGVLFIGTGGGVALRLTA